MRMHEIIIIVAKYFVVLPLIGVGIVALQLKGRERYEFIGVVVGGGILSLLISRLSSHMYHDPRPFVVGHFKPLIPHGNDNGFPSDHTLISSFFGFTTLYYSRKYGTVLLVLAALIGWSRVAAGVHHLTDVVGSFVIAAIGSAIAYFIARAIRPQQQ